MHVSNYLYHNNLSIHLVKKFQLSQGIELTIRSDAMEYPDKIVSTVVDGKRVIQIVCEDDDTYDAFA